MKTIDMPSQGQTAQRETFSMNHDPITPSAQTMHESHGTHRHVSRTGKSVLTKHNQAVFDFNAPHDQNNSQDTTHLANIQTWYSSRTSAFVPETTSNFSHVFSREDIAVTGFSEVSNADIHDQAFDTTTSSPLTPLTPFTASVSDFPTWRSSLSMASMASSDNAEWCAPNAAKEKESSTGLSTGAILGIIAGVALVGAAAAGGGGGGGGGGSSSSTSNTTDQGTSGTTGTTGVTGTVDHAPVLATALPKYAASIGGVLDYVLSTGAFTDEDNDPLTYSARMADGSALPAWLSINSATGEIKGTPPVGADTPDLPLIITADDGRGGKATGTVHLSIESVDSAPIVDAGMQNVTTTVNRILNIPIAGNTFYDPNDDELSYSVTQSDGSALPAWIKLNPDTDTIETVPGLGTEGVYQLKLTADDGRGKTTDTTFSLTVNAAVNTAPFLANSLPDFSAKKAMTMTTDISAHFADSDEDPITYSFTVYDPIFPTTVMANPSWIKLDSKTGVFTFTPPDTHIANSYQLLRVVVTASDGKHTAAELPQAKFTLTAMDASNAVPVLAHAVADQTIDENQAFSVTLPFGKGIFTDANVGDNLTYSLRTDKGFLPPAWLTFDPATLTLKNTAGLTPSSADVGTLNFKLKVSDGAGGVANTNFNLIVTPNLLPVAHGDLPSTGLKVGQSLSYAIPKGSFTDTDGDTLTYTAKLSNGAALPSWLKFDATTQTFSGIPSISDLGTMLVVVRADDGHRGWATNSFQIGVAAAEPAPVINVANVTPIINENTTGVVTTVTGENIVSWSLEGRDKGFFSIDNSGKLSLIQAMNYEAPADAIKNNNYEVTLVGTSKGGTEVRQDINVKIGDVTEMPSMITGTSYLTGVQQIDGLLTSHATWNPAGTAQYGATLTYAFENIGTNLGGGYNVTTADQQFNDTTKAFFRSMLSRVSELTNLNLVESTSQADIAHGGADIRIFASSRMALGSAGHAIDNNIGGWAFLPSGDGHSNDVYGNIYMPDGGNMSLNTNTIAGLTSFGTFATIHEIGHAMGLAHSFNDAATSTKGYPGAGFQPYDSTLWMGTNVFGQVTGGAQNSPNTDQPIESVMTYDSLNTSSHTVLSADFGLWDVATLQHLYGANMSFHAGDDVYVYQGNTGIQTIWDAGGTDTIKSISDQNDIIDLRQGHFSRVGDMAQVTQLNTDNFVKGSETLVNAAAGTLYEEGNNLYINWNADYTGDATIQYTSATDNKVHRAYAQFTASTDNSQYNLAIDYGVTISNATVEGKGNNILIGNDASNILTGGGGNDTMTGNGGADYFRFPGINGNIGNNTITDFTTGQDVVQLKTDMVDKTTFSNGVLTVQGLGSITLANVAHMTAGVDYMFVL